MAPLLQPADCSVLLVDPRMNHLGRVDAARHPELARRLSLTKGAVLAGRVPLHLAFPGQPPEAQEWLAAPSPASHVHALGTAGSSWSSSGLHAVLAAENRTSLIVCGFWLETTVTFLVLPALASGFEVFILIDATPASAAREARPATDRLLHAGAVPITTRQLIAEWIETSPEPDARSALALLAPTN
jgi:nicotinamidase-related amidase